jgi:sec-independent protein translocase protein TatA
VWRNIQGWQLFIIIIAIIVLVGWKRLPDVARSVGRSMRIFKSEVEQMADKDDDRPSAASSDVVEGQPRPTDRGDDTTDRPSAPAEHPASSERRNGDGDPGEPRP